MRMVQVPFGDTMVSRLEPDMGPEGFKSYSMRRPRSTHWRRATCEEVDCRAYIEGFVTTVDIGTELGQRQFHFITHDKKRSYSMQRVGPTVVKFLFKPGTICMGYEDHKVPLDKLPFFLVHEGDWRGNPRGGSPFVHKRVIDWVDDFATHQMKLAETLRRG